MHAPSIEKRDAPELNVAIKIGAGEEVECGRLADVTGEREGASAFKGAAVRSG